MTQGMNDRQAVLLVIIYINLVLIYNSSERTINPEFVYFWSWFQLWIFYIPDFVRFGILSFQDFVQFCILSIRDLVQFGIFYIPDFFILDFANSGLCPFRDFTFLDFVQCGILSCLDFVQFEILIHTKHNSDKSTILTLLISDQPNGTSNPE